MNDPKATRKAVRKLLPWLVTLLVGAALIGANSLTAAAEGQEKRFKVQWVARHREVTLEYRHATAQLETAQDSHRKARQRHRLQGERRVELKTKLEAAETRYAAAKQAIDDFPEAARRARVPPGWFR